MMMMEAMMKNLMLMMIINIMMMMIITIINIITATSTIIRVVVWIGRRAITQSKESEKIRFNRESLLGHYL